MITSTFFAIFFQNNCRSLLVTLISKLFLTTDGHLPAANQGRVQLDQDDDFPV